MCSLSLVFVKSPAAQFRTSWLFWSACEEHYCLNKHTSLSLSVSNKLCDRRVKLRVREWIPALLAQSAEWSGLSPPSWLMPVCPVTSSSRSALRRHRLPPETWPASVETSPGCCSETEEVFTFRRVFGWFCGVCGCFGVYLFGIHVLLWSYEPRSSQVRCNPSCFSRAPERWSTGNSRCCAPVWCAPQMTPSYCQTYLSPDLQQHREADSVWNDVLLSY